MFPYRTLITAAAVIVTLVSSGCGGGGSDTDAANTSESVRAQALSATLPNSNPIMVRARGDLGGTVGPIMEVRVNGALIGSVEVQSKTFTTYSFPADTIPSGATVDVVFTNDGRGADGSDRNLYVTSIQQGTQLLLATASTVSFDRGDAAKAFDGLDVLPGRTDLYWGGALRFAWPVTAVGKANEARYAAARFLQQSTFGPTAAEIDKVVAQGYSSWIDQQQALPYTPDFTNFIQKKYDQGDAYRPGGSNYAATWVTQQFWTTAALSQDQLRKRVAFALQNIFTVSQQDSNLWAHSRAYANYVDLLNKNAFGNFRNLLQDVAMSPAMGIYLSHMRNRPEDASVGRQPDENFARELMQLFTIGLHELNADGTAKLDANGQMIETYSNDDVMALAKVFTGWSWAMDTSDRTLLNFRWASPNYKTDADRGFDMQPMVAYPGLNSGAVKAMFVSKGSRMSIAAGASADESLKVALDTLFQHPNVGPFIGRQLIQRLVTSNPSSAYVARVAAVFANNGKGVRGDLAAVVRAILLDTEARVAPTLGFGKLKEPILRVTNWMRAFNAVSTSGEYLLTYELDALSQRPTHAPSVFGFFRPGYIPPQTYFSSINATAPEFQLVNESTVAYWINMAEAMASYGIGWNGKSVDIASAYGTQLALLATDDPSALVENINLLLFAGTMSNDLKSTITSALGTVLGSTAGSQLNRVSLAVYLALSSPEFIAQR